MSDIENARTLGGLESRVTSLEGRVHTVETKMDEHHAAQIAALSAIKGVLDQQRGGILVIRRLGAFVMALSGWSLFFTEFLRGHR